MAVGGTSVNIIEFLFAVNDGQARASLRNFSKDIRKELMGWRTYGAGTFDSAFNTPKNFAQFRNNLKVLQQDLNSGRTTGLLTGKAMQTAFSTGRLELQKLSGDLKRWVGFNQLTNQLNGLSTSMMSFGKNMQWSGRQLVVGLSLPIVMFAKKAINAFISVDREYTRLRKVITNDSWIAPVKEYGNFTFNILNQITEKGKETQKAIVFNTDNTKTLGENLKSVAVELSNVYGVSQVQIAGLMADWAAMGYQAADLGAIVTQVLKTSILGDFGSNLEGASNLVRSTMAIWTQGVDDIAGKIQETEFLMAKFSAIEASTSIWMQDLSTALPEVANSAKLFGLTAEEIVSILATMKQRGIETAESAHGLKFVLQRLLDPTDKAKEKFENLAGIDLDQLLGGKTGLEKLKALAAALVKLSSEGPKAAEIAAVLAGELGGKRQVDRFLSGLLGINKGIEELNTKDPTQFTEDFARGMYAATQGAKDATAAREMLLQAAEKKIKVNLESPAQQMNILKQTFNNLMVSVGAELAPTFIKAFRLIVKVFEKIVELPGPIKKFIQFIGVIAVAVGPIILIFGQFVLALGAILKMATFLPRVFSKWMIGKKAAAEDAEAILVLNGQIQKVTQSAEQQMIAMANLTDAWRDLVNYIKEAQVVSERNAKAEQKSIEERKAWSRAFVKAYQADKRARQKIDDENAAAAAKHAEEIRKIDEKNAKARKKYIDDAIAAQDRYNKKLEEERLAREKALSSGTAAAPRIVSSGIKEGIAEQEILNAAVEKETVLTKEIERLERRIVALKNLKNQEANVAIAEAELEAKLEEQRLSTASKEIAVLDASLSLEDRILQKIILKAESDGVHLSFIEKELALRGFLIDAASIEAAILAGIITREEVIQKALTDELFMRERITGEMYAQFRIIEDTLAKMLEAKGLVAAAGPAPALPGSPSTVSTPSVPGPVILPYSPAPVDKPYSKPSKGPGPAPTAPVPEALPTPVITPKIDPAATGSNIGSKMKTGILGAFKGNWGAKLGSAMLPIAIILPMVSKDSSKFSSVIMSFSMLLMFIDPLIKGLTALGTKIMGLIETAGGLGAAFSKLGSAFAVLLPSGPVGWIIAIVVAILALIPIIAKLTGHWDEFVAGWKKGTKDIGDRMRAIWNDYLKPVWEAFKESLSELGRMVGRIFKEIGSAFGGSGNKGKKSGEETKSSWAAVGEIYGKIATGLSYIFNILSTIVGVSMMMVTAFIRLVSFVVLLVVKIGNFFGIWKAIGNIIGFIAMLFQKKWSDAIKYIARFFIDLIVMPFVKFVDAIVGWAKKIPIIGKKLPKDTIDLSDELKKWENKTLQVDGLAIGFDLKPNEDSDGKPKIDWEGAAKVEKPEDDSAQRAADEKRQKENEFLGELKSQMDTVVNKFKEQAIAAFDKMQKAEAEAFDKRQERNKKKLELEQAKILKVYDRRVKAIEDLNKADAERYAKEEYLSKRREILNERQFNKEVYLRNRRLAMFSGNIDEVRRLDIDEIKSRKDSAKSLKDLDEQRRREMVQKERQATIDRINAAKEARQKVLEQQMKEFEERQAKAKEKFQQMQSDAKQAYQDQLDLITRYTPRNVGELQTMLNQMNAAMVRWGAPGGVFRNTGKLAMEGFGEAMANAKESIKQKAKWVGADVGKGLGDSLKDGFDKTGIPDFIKDRMKWVKFQALAELLGVNVSLEYITEGKDKGKMRAVFDNGYSTTNPDRATLYANAQAGNGGGGSRVTRRAIGGIIERPEVSLIGEAGPELVLPLNNPARMQQIVQDAQRKGLIGKMKFASPMTSKISSNNRTISGGDSGGGLMVQETNIYVDNFIGEKAWFESMMKDYNIRVRPADQASKGRVTRNISSYKDNLSRYA